MKWTERRISLLLILPAVVYVVAFAFYPIILAVYGSFQTHAYHNVLSNYVELPSFGLYDAIDNTVYVTLAALAFQFVIAFVVANILTRQFRARPFFFVLIILPFATATVVAGFIFGVIFFGYGSLGYANSFLNLVGLPAVNWTGSYGTSLLTLVLADGWKNIPIVALILMAGMTTIPQDIYRAAEVDGAGSVSKFFRLTLPNMRSYIAIALIIRGVSEFNIFAIALLDFPHTLLTTLTYGLRDYSNPFISEASATILLGFVLAFTLIVVYFRGRGRE